MKIDFKSFLIGILFALVVVLFLGLKNENRIQKMKLVLDKPIPIEIVKISDKYTLRQSGKNWILVLNECR